MKVPSSEHINNNQHNYTELTTVSDTTKHLAATQQFTNSEVRNWINSGNSEMSTVQPSGAVQTTSQQSNTLNENQQPTYATMTTVQSQMMPQQPTTSSFSHSCVMSEKPAQDFISQKLFDISKIANLNSSRTQNQSNASNRNQHSSQIRIKSEIPNSHTVPHNIASSNNKATGGLPGISTFQYPVSRTTGNHANNRQLPKQPVLPHIDAFKRPVSTNIVPSNHRNVENKSLVYSQLTAANIPLPPAASVLSLSQASKNKKSARKKNKKSSEVQKNGAALDVSNVTVKSERHDNANDDLINAAKSARKNVKGPKLHKNKDTSKTPEKLTTSVTSINQLNNVVGNSFSAVSRPANFSHIKVKTEMVEELTSSERVSMNPPKVRRRKINAGGNPELNTRNNLETTTVNNAAVSSQSADEPVMKKLKNTDISKVAFAGNIKLERDNGDFRATKSVVETAKAPAKKRKRKRKKDKETEGNLSKVNEDGSTLVANEPNQHIESIADNKLNETEESVQSCKKKRKRKIKTLKTTESITEGKADVSSSPCEIKKSKKEPGKNRKSKKVSKKTNDDNNVVTSTEEESVISGNKMKNSTKKSGLQTNVISVNVFSLNETSNSDDVSDQPAGEDLLKKPTAVESTQQVAAKKGRRKSNGDKNVEEKSATPAIENKPSKCKTVAEESKKQKSNKNTDNLGECSLFGDTLDRSAVESSPLKVKKSAKKAKSSKKLALENKTRTIDSDSSEGELMIDEDPVETKVVEKKSKTAAKKSGRKKKIDGSVQKLEETSETAEERISSKKRGKKHKTEEAKEKSTVEDLDASLVKTPAKKRGKKQKAGKKDLVSESSGIADETLNTEELFDKKKKSKVGKKKTAKNNK